MGNYVNVTGTVARKPEPMYTPSGKLRSELLLAVSRGRRREDGTDWIRAVVWERTAEACVRYLEKGATVQVTGRLRGDFYDSKETGKKKLGMEVIGQRVDFLSRPSGRSAAPSSDSDGSNVEEAAEAVEAPRSNGRSR
jgi:single-strand DNA-binding protein